MDWKDQPQVPIGQPLVLTPKRFSGLTIRERHHEESPPAYTAEERAALCEVCGMLEMSWQRHHASQLHRDRYRAAQDAAAMAAAVAVADPPVNARTLRGTNAQEAVDLLGSLDPGRLREHIEEALLDFEDEA
ncbi:hypothetical protein HPB48_018561 [Haemaphysalis longicornis]|uniref:Uncharacterized protein n=1 Tax=Haemaphysalis longicornis TaxID=44386 RepID=A0A9J6G0N8_HAELO|nr:hypothetical protein HPB48_018561 [Haemaphysalis longicornis]